MASSGSIWVSLGLKTANFQKGLKGAKGQLSGFQKGMAGLKGMFNPFTIGAGAVAGLGAAFIDAFNRVKTFDNSIKNLSSITGAVGKDLDFLKDKAIELGKKTSLTAGEVADGFKLIASAKPELLDSGEALAHVTEKAILLSEAATVDMAQASRALTLSLNQFGEGADKAGAFVDVLAAGSKQGAGDIEFLNASLEKTGGAANAAGLSFVDTVAAIETIAPVMATGEEAGTKFRNILANLQKEGIGFASGQFNINDALEETSAMLSNIKDPAERAAARIKLFGKQNDAAGIQLLNNMDTLEDFQVSLNETGVALAQQKTNLDTVDGAMARLDSAYEGFILSVDDGGGVLTEFVKVLGDTGAGIINFISDLNKGMNVIDAFTASGGTLISTFTNIDKATADNIAFINNHKTALQGLEIMLQKGKITQEQYTKAIEKLKGGWESTRGLATEAAEEVKTEIDAKNAAAAATTALSDKEKEQIALKRELIAEYGNLGVVSSKTAQGLKLTANSTDEITAKIQRLTSSLGTMEIGTEAYTKLDEQIDLLKTNLEAKKLKIGIYPSVQAISEEEMATYNAQQEQLKASADLVGGAIADSFGAMAQGMVANMGFADDAMGRFQQSMASTVISLITQYLAQAMAAAIAGASTSASATGPGAVVAGPTFIATAIASILGAFASIPAFAEGGLVFNDMIGLIGEGKGTTRSNPEVIAPLDKLKNFMGDQGGGMAGEVVFRIQGDELVGMLNRKNKVNKFSR